MPSNVTGKIRQLAFVPSPHRLLVGSSENTTFSITSDDGQGGTAFNGSTVIRVAASSGGPVFAGLPDPPPLSLPLATTIKPFGSVTVSDVQNITLTLQISNALWGAFTSNSLAALGFTNSAPGTYQVSGTASNVTVALQALDFAPNTNQPLGTIIVFSLLIPVLIWRSLASLHSEEEIEE